MAFDTVRLGPRWAQQRALAASVVLAAHLLMLWALWQLKQRAQPQAHAAQSIPIRFVADRRARADSQPTSVKARPARSAERSSAVAMPADSAVEAAAPAGSETWPSTAAAGQGRPAAAASAPGTLALKPDREVMLGSLSNPAVTDPRSNTPKPTFEERIAMGLDPDLCVKLERLPNGEVRRRMGRMVNAQSAIQNSHGVGPQGIKVCQ